MRRGSKIIFGRNISRSFMRRILPARRETVSQFVAVVIRRFHELLRTAVVGVMAIYRQQSKTAGGPGRHLRAGGYLLTGNPSSWGLVPLPDGEQRSSELD